MEKKEDMKKSKYKSQKRKETESSVKESISLLRLLRREQKSGNRYRESTFATNGDIDRLWTFECSSFRGHYLAYHRGISY